jgi:hypothetical protein
MELMDTFDYSKIKKKHYALEGVSQADEAESEVAGQQARTPSLQSIMLLFYLLFTDEGQEPHKAGALDRGREFALVLCANAGVARVNDLCLARNKPLQKVDFFIVHVH